jgi:hypothetical protein
MSSSMQRASTFGCGSARQATAQRSQASAQAWQASLQA